MPECTLIYRGLIDLSMLSPTIENVVRLVETCSVHVASVSFSAGGGNKGNWRSSISCSVSSDSSCDDTGDSSGDDMGENGGGLGLRWQSDSSSSLGVDKLCQHF